MCWRECVLDCEFGNVLNMTQERISKKFVCCISLKLETSVYQKMPLRKESPQNGRRYLTYM